MTTLILKKCKKCGQEKMAHDFFKSKKSPSGRAYECKKCSYEMTRESREKNPKLTAETQKKYREKNKEKRNNATKQCREKNRERYYVTRKIWLHENHNLIKNYNIKTTFRRRFLINTMDIPREIVELKSLQLTLYRLIKEKVKNKALQKTQSA